jgi:mRNA-degrading endonuclease RelE of RelBE toxin-antitoxin system
MAVLLITQQAQDEFDQLPKVVRVRLANVFRRLEAWPETRGAKPLRGQLAGYYRIRSGDYRVQFRVEAGGKSSQPLTPDTVYIEKVGNRDGFYDDQ